MLKHSDLLDCLKYDLNTGIFYWQKQLSKRILIGDIAGSKTDKGYKLISINNIKYRAHHLAWFYINGIFSKTHLDHINNDRMDNRICNLREANTKQNSENKVLDFKNKSGLRGVCFDKKRNKWASFISHNNKTIALGRFEFKEDAYQAYIQAVNKLHTHNPLCQK